MKKILFSILIGLALCMVSLAQPTAPPQPAPGQTAAPQQQPPASQQPSAPSQSNPQQQAPAQQQPPAAGQPAAPSAGAQPPAAPTGPQAKSKEEFDAYTAAVNEADPAKAEAAIIAFEQ